MISWAILESGIPEKSEEVESEKETFNEIQEASPGSSTFIDPFEEFQSEGDRFLEALICLWALINDVVYTYTTKFFYTTFS